MKNVAAWRAKIVTRYSKGIVLYLLAFASFYILLVTVLRFFTGMEPAESTDNLVKALCCGEFGALGFIKGVETISSKISDKKDKFRG